MCREMKDSGIQWIGKIPQGWKLIKYKYFARSGMGETILSERLSDDGVPVYSATQSDKVFGHLKNPNLILKRGDLVIPARGNSIGCVSIIKDEIATCTQTTIYSRIDGISREYLYYCCNGLKDNWFEFDNTAIPQITVKQVQNNIVPVPEEYEQIKIANYLDKKVSQIDDIILKQKSLIEKYKAYKQSLITETVTKGLNKNVPMKDSGIEWIGEIPSHWDLVKLKFIFTIKKEIANKLGYDILSVTQSGVKVKDIYNNEGQISADYSKYQLVDIDDFVMNHMDLLTGFVDCSKFKGVTSPDYRVFRFINNNKNSKRYYNYILQSCYKNKIFYGLGQGVSNLGRWRLQTDKFMNFILPVCSLEEQKEIADFLDKKCKAIDCTISKKQQLIKKLELYKKSLIYECVTGKREVN